MYEYTDYSKPPFIDVTFPPAIILSKSTLLGLYTSVVAMDFYLLYHERQLKNYITPTQLRLGMAIIHSIIPMVFISNNPPLNIMFAAVPWFLATYSAHMPTEDLTLEKWICTLFRVTIKEDTNVINSNSSIRYKGISKFSLGLFKLAFMHTIIDPLLPHRSEYALNYAWFDPMSLFYTVLFGIKAYCMLSFVDIIMGIEQTLFAWNMVDLFESPVLSSSPRDFWR